MTMSETPGRFRVSAVRTMRTLAEKQGKGCLASTPGDRVTSPHYPPDATDWLIGEEGVVDSFGSARGCDLIA